MVSQCNIKQSTIKQTETTRIMSAGKHEAQDGNMTKQKEQGTTYKTFLRRHVIGVNPAMNTEEDQATHRTTPGTS